MPKVLLDDPFVMLNAVDFSGLIKQVELELDRAQLDQTAGGDKTQISQPGLKVIGFRITAFQDYADNQLDEQLFTWWDAATEIPVRIRPNKTNAISAANPEYQFNAYVKSYPPLSAQHGALVMANVAFMNSSGVTRDIVP